MLVLLTVLYIHAFCKSSVCTKLLRSYYPKSTRIAECSLLHLLIRVLTSYHVYKLLMCNTTQKVRQLSLLTYLFLLSAFPDSFRCSKRSFQSILLIALNFVTLFYELSIFSFFSFWFRIHFPNCRYLLQWTVSPKILWKSAAVVQWQYDVYSSSPVAALTTEKRKSTRVYIKLSIFIATYSVFLKRNVTRSLSCYETVVKNRPEVQTWPTLFSLLSKMVVPMQMLITTAIENVFEWWLLYVHA